MHDVKYYGRPSTVFNNEEQANDGSPYQYAHQNGFRLPSRLLRPEPSHGNAEAIPVPKKIRKTDRQRQSLSNKK